HHAARRGRKENLVRLTSLVGRDLADPGGDAEIATDLNDRLARDPFQHSGVRRDDDAVNHHKDIEARTFRDVAVAVEQEREVGSPIERFELASREVGPMEVLRGGIDGARWYAQRLGDDEVTPALLDLGAHDPDPGNSEGGNVVAGMHGMIRLARGWTTSEAIHRDIGVF